HTRPALIVLAAGLLAASGGTAVAATHLTGAGGGTARPAAMLANCPVFPANNVWNTDVSKLPADPHSAAWLRSMHSASTYLHPDFGPSGGYPYGIPYTVVTSSHATVSVRFQYASESDRRPYPFGSDTRIEGGRNAGGARHEAGSGGSQGLPPMGARFRLKLSFNVAGFCRSTAYCADAKAVLTEMQHYGLILADNGSNWYFGGAAFPQWPSALVELLKRI